MLHAHGFSADDLDAGRKGLPALRGHLEFVGPGRDAAALYRRVAVEVTIEPHSHATLRRVDGQGAGRRRHKIRACPAPLERDTEGHSLAARQLDLLLHRLEALQRNPNGVLTGIHPLERQRGHAPHLAVHGDLGAGGLAGHDDAAPHPVVPLGYRRRVVALRNQVALHPANPLLAGSLNLARRLLSEQLAIPTKGVGEPATLLVGTGQIEGQRRVGVEFIGSLEEAGRGRKPALREGLRRLADQRGRVGSSLFLGPV